MENPNSWGPVERTIYKAINDHEELMTYGFCGQSLEMSIANDLRKAGLIKEDNGNIPQDSDAVQA